ncbi:hypothetical protein [Qipengyuania sp. SM2507]
MSAILSLLGREACASARNHGAVRAQTLALAEGRAQLLAHNERAWASGTYSGARHSLELKFEGADAVAAGERFVAALADHPFAIPNHLVVEAKVPSCETRCAPETRMIATAELLLVEDN